MTTAYTSLLGLALPVTGELSGTWGDTVNNSITSLLDSAIAGTTTLSTDADVTLTTTTGAANTSREAILLWTAGGTVTRNITAPAQSKIYTVINASSSTQSIVLRGAGPTTGVTIIKGESAVCAWNGSDFIKISNTAGAATVSDLTVTSSATLSYGTANGVAYLNGSKVLTTGSALTFDGAKFGVTTSGNTGASVVAYDATASKVYIQAGGASPTAAYVQLGVDGSNGASYLNDYYGYGLVFQRAGTEAMRLDSSGNLGVGTATAGNAGAVNVSIGAPGTTAGGLQLWTNTTSSSYLQWGTAASGTSYYRGYLQYNYNAGSDYLAFGIAGTEAMRLTNGNLLVGTTTGRTSKIVVEADGTTTYGITSNMTAASGTRYHIIFRENGTERGSITSNGTITVYNTTSDYRLKTVIGSVSGSGERIDALQPVEYTWNSDGSHTRGFLAHQFQEVYADSVTGSKDAVDAKGKPVYQAMQAGSSEVIADLVAEIQSLRKRLTALEGKA